MFGRAGATTPTFFPTNDWISLTSAVWSNILALGTPKTLSSSWFLWMKSMVSLLSIPHSSSLIRSSHCNLQGSFLPWSLNPTARDENSKDTIEPDYPDWCCPTRLKNIWYPHSGFSTYFFEMKIQEKSEYHAHFSQLVLVPTIEQKCSKPIPWVLHEFKSMFVVRTIPSEVIIWTSIVNPFCICCHRPSNKWVWK